MVSPTLCTTLALLLSLSAISGLPTPTEDILQETSDMAMSKRPKYMDTRRELDVFKDLVLMSIKELVDEAHLNPNVLADNQPTAPVQKRQYMGICMKKHYNNFIPVPCVRAGR